MDKLPDPFEMGEGSDKLTELIERGLPEEERQARAGDKSKWASVTVRIPLAAKRRLESLKRETHVPMEEWVSLAIVRFLDAYAKGEGEPIEIRQVATRNTIW